MTKRRMMLGTLTLLLLSVVLTGCLGALFGPSAADVKGTIKYENGDPVASATVKIGGKQSKTNSQGAYTVREVKNGTHTLTVTVDGKQVYDKKINVNGKTVTHNITLENPAEPEPDRGTIQGTVTYDDGTPVQDAEVAIEDENISDITDADGEYALADVPYGNYTVVVSVNGAEADQKQVEVDADTVTADFTLPAPQPEPVVVYEQDFSGPGSTLEDFDDWEEGSGKWSIVEHDGKHWAQVEANGSDTTHAYLEVPEIVDADVVTLEYTAHMPGAAGYGVGLFVSDPSSSALGGRSIMIRRGWPDQALESRDGGSVIEEHGIGGVVALDSVVTFKLIYDRATRRITATRDDIADGEFIFDMTDDWYIDSPENRYLKLYVQGADQKIRWTDIRITVE